jgi:transposase
MAQPQKPPLRPVTEQEHQEMQRIVKATSERVDVVRRARALLAVAEAQTWTQAARAAGFKRRASVGQLVDRFNHRGLAALLIAPGRGRKRTYGSAERTRILAEAQRAPDRRQDATATWSLATLEQALRKDGLPRVGATTIRRVLREARYAPQRTRTWCPTGTALRVRKAGTVPVQDPQAQEKQRLIELAYEQAERAGLVQLNEDEAGPYQAIPHPGIAWQPEGHPARQPHEYVRGGTAKLLTLFRPATGEVWAKGVQSAPNVILHPWLQGHLCKILAALEKEHPRACLPPEEERPLYARWETWLGHPPRGPLPPLRIILIWDNLAGHLTPDLVGWLFDHGVLPLYTPLSGSWLNMAESVQRILVRRALSGQHPETAQQVIDWLEQTVAGWNLNPTAFVWNGKRRQRRMQARLRQLGGSGAALVKGASFVA